MSRVRRLDDRVSSVSVEDMAGKTSLERAANEDTQAGTRMTMLLYALPGLVCAERPMKSTDSSGS